MAYEDPALSAYRQVDVKTASQGELILLLYDEGIKQLGCAIELMDVQKIPASDIERVHRHYFESARDNYGAFRVVGHGSRGEDSAELAFYLRVFQPAAVSREYPEAG